MKRIIYLLALLLPFAVQSAAPNRPNIVVILSDDMGFSDIGCYGSEINTPNLDRLAARGLRFTQFYNTARCCPTRASLLTGLYPHQAGVGHMTEDKGLEGYQGELNRHCVTIAEALKPAGYRTYAVGKWHVARNTKPDGPKDDWPLQRGFDRYYGTIAGAGSYFDPSALVRDNTMLAAGSDPEYAPAEFYYTDAISDQASRFVTEHKRDHAGQPFFMYVAFTAAHWPLHAKEADIAKYRGKYDAGYEPIRKARFEKEKKLGLISPSWELSPQAGDWAGVTNKAWEARCMEVYAAQIDCLDQGIGRIVATLEKSGQLDNTLLFFLQDNGGCAEATGRNGRTPRANKPTLPPLARDTILQGSRPDQTRDGWPMLGGTAVMPGPRDTFIAYGKAWANVSNTPFREYKHWVHEGGISTPLIVHWPGRIRGGGELRSQPGHLIDIMATCLDVAGAKYPATFAGQPTTPFEGKSLLPAFENKPIEREAIYWEHEGNRAVRVGKWKLVAKGPAGPWELYDMEADRTELHDLAAQQPGRVKDMTAKWEAYARRANVLPWIWKPAYGQAAEPAAKPKADRPNIVLILTDDMGYGDVGCYGGQFAPTPNIDRMAKEGIRFTQYYSASPICSPSRTGLTTGMEPARWRITSYLQTRAGNRACEQADFLDTQAPSIARRLKRSGYATGHFGKWHMGGGRDVTNAPLFAAYGFDEHAGTYESPEPHPDITSTNWIWSPNDKVKRWDRTAFFVDQTLDFLRRHTNQPCYVNLWPDDTHTPWVPSQERLGLYPNGPEEERKFRAVLDEYDRQMGRLFAGIKELGLDEKTLIIFTSDNGPLPSFRGSRSGGLRGSKLSLYEGGTRMPFIVRWPGHVPAGRVDDQTVIAAVDLFPSFCAFAGTEPPPNRRFAGEDMSQALLGQPAKRARTLFWEYGRNNQSFAYPRGRDRSPNLALREGNWKFLINADGTGAELYDLAADPKETTNLAEREPQTTARLSEQLLNWRKSLP